MGGFVLLAVVAVVCVVWLALGGPDWKGHTSFTVLRAERLAKALRPR